MKNKSLPPFAILILAFSVLFNFSTVSAQTISITGATDVTNYQCFDGTITFEIIPDPLNWGPGVGWHVAYGTGDVAFRYYPITTLTLTGQYGTGAYNFNYGGYYVSSLQHTFNEPPDVSTWTLEKTDAPANGCLGSYTVYYHPSSPCISYPWRITDGSSSAYIYGNTHQVNNAGVGNYSFTCLDNVVAASFSFTIGQPVSNGSVNVDPCAGNIHFTSSDCNFTSWSAVVNGVGLGSFPNTQTSAAFTPVNPLVGGTVTYTVTTNSGFTESNSIIIPSPTLCSGTIQASLSGTDSVIINYTETPATNFCLGNGFLPPTWNVQVSGPNGNLSAGANYGTPDTLGPLSAGSYTISGGGCNALPVTLEVVLSNQTWYIDADGDGYGSINNSILAAQQPQGYVSNSSDCDDTPGSGFFIHPGATEIPNNNIDENCDPSDDNNANLDFDGDGFTIAQGDCDDSDIAINPGHAEICGDGKDNNCDGLTDIILPCHSSLAAAVISINPGAGFGCPNAVNTQVTFITESNCSFGWKIISATLLAVPIEGQQTEWEVPAGEQTTTIALPLLTNNTGGGIDLIAFPLFTEQYEDLNSVICSDHFIVPIPSSAGCNATVSVSNITPVSASEGGSAVFHLNSNACDRVALWLVNLVGSNGQTAGSGISDLNLDEDILISDIPEGTYNILFTTPFCPNNNGGTITIPCASATTWYKDADGDGFGNINITKLACAKPDSFVSNHDDCIDTDPTVTIAVFATIDPSGTVNICKNQNDLGLVAHPLGATTYQWYKNNSPVAGLTSSLAFVSKGKWKVEINSSGNCHSISPETIVKEKKCRRDEVEGDLNQLENSSTSNQLLIYPNPASSKVEIDLTDFDGSANLYIYNMLGQLIKTIAVSSADETPSIDVSNLPAGIYEVILKGDDVISKGRFIKK